MIFPYFHIVTTLSIGIIPSLYEIGRFFNYSSTAVSFRVRWTNRFFGLFATTYAISSEMATTDRYDNNVVRFPRNERIRSTDVIAEKVEHFLDLDFWGEYNVIEPDQEITEAVKRLSGKLRRRDQQK